MEFDTFISYKHGVHEDIVIKVKNELKEKYGLKVWFDDDKLLPPERLYSDLQKGIEASKNILCFITEEYDQAPNCIKEITYASRLNKPLIVLMFTRSANLKNIRFLISDLIAINVYDDIDEFRSLEGNNYDKMIRALAIVKKEAISEPIRLVYRNEDNKLMLNAKALNVIENIEGNIGVCIIVGPYRQGKSFLMNRLLNCSSRFKIGHTDQSCTKGIWMLDTPVKYTINNKEINVIFMDTEGLESSDANDEWDKKIFILSMLISSFFIYNTTNTLDRKSITSLALVASFSKQVLADASNNSADHKSFKDELPDFIWVVRDYRLEQTMEPHEMLNSFLELALGNDGNNIRNAILNSFRSLKCAYLPIPELEESNGKSIGENLRNLENIPWEALRENFRKSMDSLCEDIRNNIFVKKINGKILTGPVFAKLIFSFVKNLNMNQTIYWNDFGQLALNNADHDQILKNNIPIMAPVKYRIKRFENFHYGLDKEAIEYHISFCNENYPLKRAGIWRKIFENNNDSSNWPSIFRKPNKTKRDEEIISKYVARWRRVPSVLSGSFINSIARALPGMWRWPYYALICLAFDIRDNMLPYLSEYPDLVIEPGFVIYFDGDPQDSCDIIEDP